MPSVLTDAEARKLEQSLYDAMVARDEPTLKRLVHESVTYMHSTGRFETRQQFLDTVVRERQYTKFDHQDVQSRLMPGCVVLMSQVTLNAENRPPNNVPFQSQVWVEFADGWKLVLRQATKP